MTTVPSDARTTCCEQEVRRLDLLNLTRFRNLDSLSPLTAAYLRMLFEQIWKYSLNPWYLMNLLYPSAELIKKPVRELNLGTVAIRAFYDPDIEKLAEGTSVFGVHFAVGEYYYSDAECQVFTPGDHRYHLMSSLAGYQRLTELDLTTEQLYEVDRRVALMDEELADWGYLVTPNRRRVLVKIFQDTVVDVRYDPKIELFNVQENRYINAPKPEEEDDRPIRGAALKVLKRQERQAMLVRGFGETLQFYRQHDHWETSYLAASPGCHDPQLLEYIRSLQMPQPAFEPFLFSEAVFYGTVPTDIQEMLLLLRREIRTLAIRSQTVGATSRAAKMLALLEKYFGITIERIRDLFDANFLSRL